MITYIVQKSTHHAHKIHEIQKIYFVRLYYFVFIGKGEAVNERAVLHMHPRIHESNKLFYIYHQRYTHPRNKKIWDVS